jgi:glycosyltransferase involved in cell wall biosynthesis
MPQNSGKRATVNILLSTYNGDRYLRELLDSLERQTWPEINIHIRDDGSNDNSLEKMQKFCRTCRFPTRFEQGGNIGVKRSFLSLLRNTKGRNALYAFCDQDDVWKPNKVLRAVEHIGRQQNPHSTLYCSRLEYVDKNLGHLGYSAIPHNIGFSNAVVENIATGCSVVFGERIRTLLLQANPEDMVMHDWWAYLVASAFGQVAYDNQATLRYRQHGGTLTPWEPGLVKLRARARELIKRLWSQKHDGLESINQATRFLATYPDIPEQHRKIVEQLINLKGKGKLHRKLQYILNPEVTRTNPIEQWSLKLMILLGWH